MGLFQWEMLMPIPISEPEGGSAPVTVSIVPLARPLAPNRPRSPVTNRYSTSVEGRVKGAGVVAFRITSSGQLVICADLRAAVHAVSLVGEYSISEYRVILIVPCVDDEACQTSL